MFQDASFVKYLFWGCQIFKSTYNPERKKFISWNSKWRRLVEAAIMAVTECKVADMIIWVSWRSAFKAYNRNANHKLVVYLVWLFPLYVLSLWLHTIKTSSFSLPVSSLRWKNKKQRRNVNCKYIRKKVILYSQRTFFGLIIDNMSYPARCYQHRDQSWPRNQTQWIFTDRDCKGSWVSCAPVLHGVGQYYCVRRKRQCSSVW